MMIAMSGPNAHVLGGFMPFGLRRCRALYSCGYQTRPVTGTDTETPEEVARQLLTTQHGAGEPYPGEAVRVPLTGGIGSVRPGPNRSVVADRKEPGTERPS